MSDMLAAYEPRRISVDEYHRMVETGIIGEDERVELIDGEIVRMSPAGRRHKAAVDRFNMQFAPRLAGRAIVRVQSGVVIADFSEPEPDLTVLRPEASGYEDREAGPDDVLLVVEIGDSSRVADRRIKLPLYARCGLREVWLVDVVADVVRVYRDLAGSEYRDTLVAGPGDTLATRAFPDDPFALDDLLRPR